jgi:hypothetical protein
MLLGAAEILADELPSFDHDLGERLMQEGEGRMKRADFAMSSKAICSEILKHSLRGCTKDAAIPDIDGGVLKFQVGGKEETVKDGGKEGAHAMPTREDARGFVR